MKKNFIIILIGIALIMLAGIYFNSHYFNKSDIDTSGIILFYGEGCSHCENVDKFIKENNIENKIKFTKLEVFKNKDNSNILVQKANACGMSTDKIGVPFLWDGSKCVVGDIDIIKFFTDAK